MQHSSSVINFCHRLNRYPSGASEIAPGALFKVEIANLTISWELKTLYKHPTGPLSTEFTAHGLILFNVGVSLPLFSEKELLRIPAFLEKCYNHVLSFPQKIS